MRHLVIGYGISGVGAIQFLRQRGYSVSAYDHKPPSEHLTRLFHELGVTFLQSLEEILRLGDIERAVVSPGIPPTHPVLVALEGLNIPIISELELVFYAENVFPIIAITGTNGKSTTSALIYHILQELSIPCTLAGNIGTSVAALAAQNQLRGICVLELSSYQIHYTKNLSVSTAVITNLTPDHLSWHGSLHHYYGSKAKIIDFLNSDKGVLVISQQAKEVFSQENIPHNYLATMTLPSTYEKKPLEKAAACAGLAVSIAQHAISVRVYDHFWQIPTDKMLIQGNHNKENAAMALAAVLCTLVKLEVGSLPFELELSKALNSFPGLAHRYQLIGTWRTLSIINDSKATNVNATITALNSSPDGIYLLLGGLAKGESFLPILRLKHKIHAIYAFGEARHEIFHQLHDNMKVYTFDTLAILLKELPHMTHRQESLLLLSPGCASFDEFSNFEHRGEFFTRVMTEIKTEHR